MVIDVFTLFPRWFGWFAEQRHVRNALALGHELNAVDLRATQPDDGPSVPDPGQASLLPVPQSEPPAAPRPVDDDRPADAVAPAPRAKAQNVRNDDESERSAGAADDDSDELDDTADDEEDDDGD